VETLPQIDFLDDRDGCLFTVTVHRKAETISREIDVLPVSLGKTSGKTSGKILAALKQDQNLTIPELASLIGVTERSIERNIKKLQEQGRLRRIGPAKGGHWEVL
jgi:ATP-dependent DNA helicase RecG